MSSSEVASRLEDILDGIAAVDAYTSGKTVDDYASERMLATRWSGTSSASPKANGQAPPSQEANLWVIEPVTGSGRWRLTHELRRREAGDQQDHGRP